MLQKQKNFLKNKNNLLVKLSIFFIIEIYRKKIKPFRIKINNKKQKITICSFYPDCSEYGILALRKYGFFKGWYKTIKRISKCTTYKHKDSCVDYP